MKKVMKVLAILTLLFSLFASIGLGAKEVLAEDTPTAEIILHKKMFETYTSPLIPNTGAPMDQFDSMEDYVEGAEFKVYDVSARYYAERDLGRTVEEALGTVRGGPTTYALETPVYTGTTDNTGTLIFNLNKFTAPGKHAVYVIVETPKEGIAILENMTLLFPVYQMNENGSYTNVELNSIHLYPKNIVSTGNLTVTKRTTGTNVLQNGAQFIIKSNRTNQFLVGVANGFYTWGEETDAYKFETGNNYSIGSTSITSAAGSLGLLNISGLVPGSYNLIETLAPAGSVMIDAQKNQEFTIVAGTTSPTTVNVLNDDIEVNKDQNGGRDNYQVGEEIPYEVSVNVPMGIGDLLPNSTTYKHISMAITDVPVAGLKYNKDLVAHMDNTAFTIDPTWLVDTANGFELTIPAASLIPHAGKKLTLNYNMYLDGTAMPGVGYDNKVEVTTSLLEDEDDTEDIYTGGKRFIKKDQASPNNLLEGAVFVVRNGVEEDAKYLHIGDNNKVTWVDNLESTDPTEVVATRYTSGSNGLISILGLRFGNYFLEEIIPPTDYVIVESKIPFEVDNLSYSVNAGVVTPTTVVNIRKGRLPSTGGSGIVGIIGAGIALVATTGGYYIKRRKEA